MLNLFSNKNIKNYEYDILIPPFENVPRQMKPLQVKEYFDWYLSQIPSRIKYLLSKCTEIHKMQDFDYSPKSLNIIWKWFLKVAVVEDTPEEKLIEMRKTLVGNPESFIEHMINQQKKKLSLVTEYIIRDIGMFMGQTFIKNHTSLRWDYYIKPKTDMFVNQPVIQGFEDRNFEPVYKPSFEPIHMVGVQAAKILKNEAKHTDLYNLFKKWEEYT